MIDNKMQFDHIGIVASGLAIGRKHFTEIYGVNKWSKEYTDLINGVYIQFFENKEKICFELIAPLNNKSPIYNVLKKKINILNHFAYQVTNIENCSMKLLQKKFISLGPSKKAIAYDLKKIQFFYSIEFNYILELIEVSNFKHEYSLINVCN